MGLRNIYLIQVGEQCIQKNKTTYLPYAVGTVAAKAWSNKTVQKAFALARIVFLREPVEQLADSLENPFLVGYSNYIWNHEYNKAAAKKIKSKFPDCLIVFGGHNVPSDTSLLDDCSYIDILIHGEGEEVFETLLSVLASEGSLSDIPNISYRNERPAPVQTARVAMTGFDYPSPYTGGIFDRIIAEHPDMEFHGILETNRGCSNGCAYCDWGPQKTKEKMFPMERVREDIDWLSKNRIEYVWGTDSNFGQFERDFEIVDCVIDAKNKNGYPNRFRANYAKFKDRSVFELAKRFSDADLSKSTTISFQSLSDVVLKNIGRHNITLEHFSELTILYRNAGIPTYTELILALPGETYNSFLQGIEQLLEAGHHAIIEVYDCVLLANSILAGKNYLDKHEIKTVRVPFFQYHCENVNVNLNEYADIVISTHSMPPEDWVRCKLFSIIVQSMHCFGLFRCFAIYLHNEKQIAYCDFYSSLLQWFLSDTRTIGYELFTYVKEQVEKALSGANTQYFILENYGNIRWPFDEGVYLCIIDHFDRFYKETKSFLLKFDIEEDILNQLLNYQNNIILLPGQKSCEIIQDYDFYTYMHHSMNNSYVPLAKIKTRLEITITGNNYTDPAGYAREVVWYGRRLEKTVITSNPARVKLSYFEQQ